MLQGHGKGGYRILRVRGGSSGKEKAFSEIIGYSPRARR